LTSHPTRRRNDGFGWAIVTDADDVAKTGEGGSTSGAQVFPIGHLVAGRYAIVRFIGSGAASKVYEVFDSGLGVNVALKVLDPRHARDAVQLERFRREIQSARKVTHRNVCRIFDLGVENVRNTRRFFLTMELLNGTSLADRLTGGGPYSYAEALPIVTEIAEGLHAAHDAGIVHRDLKPGNVMLVRPSPETGQPASRAVITDFGLALSDEQTRLTRSDELVGTPDYMAPEQAEPGALTAAADIYALGLIMYEMLTARRPFDKGPTPLETVLLRKEVPPRPLHNLLPTVDPAWNAAILRCLEPDPARRFARVLDIVRTIKGELPVSGQKRKPKR
jgi:serine/threonine protein kinase